jgi:hypothetical protein
MKIIRWWMVPVVGHEKDLRLVSFCDPKEQKETSIGPFGMAGS